MAQPKKPRPIRARQVRTRRRRSAADIEIETRNLKFDSSAIEMGRWHSDNPYISHLWNGLSLMFPAGEQFFMDSVRRVQTQVTDPELQREIAAFLGQEGIHAREHREFNLQLDRQGYPGSLLEGITSVSLLVTRVTSSRWQLAITCAFEHFTATLSEVVLSDDAVLEGVDDEHAALWRWHCSEETEHKAVAFDVYEAISPGLVGYLRRVLVMTIILANFPAYMTFTQLALSTFDHPIPNLKKAARAFNYLWGSPGLFRQSLAHFFEYFSPAYHPWNRDNAALVEKWKAGAAHYPAAR